MLKMPVGSFETLVVPAFAMSPQGTAESWLYVFKISTQVFVLLFILIVFAAVIVNLVKSLNIIGFKVVKK
jgi:hypothetical protein